MGHGKGTSPLGRGAVCTKCTAVCRAGTEDSTCGCFSPTACLRYVLHAVPGQVGTYRVPQLLCNPARVNNVGQLSCTASIICQSWERHCSRCMCMWQPSITQWGTQGTQVSR
jgi:hypothetical protein